VEGFEEKKPKGIIITLIGGLGNQLYIYSAGKAMEQALGLPILLQLDGGTVFAHTKTDYRPILFGDYPAIQAGDERLNDSIEAGVQTTFWSQWSPDSLPKDTDKYIKITGHWYQYFPAIESIIPRVREHLTGVMREKYKDVGIEVGSSFAHIRRGDYLDKGNEPYLLGMDYYSAALTKLNENPSQVLCIFSDDIAWCKEQAWNTTKRIQYIDEPDEIKSLYMMSLCQGGAIISNSTFSTWGAILGPYEKGSMIVYPSKWLYGASTDFPKEWIRI